MVMALVPRRVRVTSVALYNFIITNISGLSTTLVPLLRARYDSTHVFRFFAEPLTGGTAAAIAAAAAAAGAKAAVGGSNSTDPVAATATATASAILLSSSSSDVGLLRAKGSWDGEGTGVEFSVTETGSLGLQKALLWMYPGMFLASSGERRFCITEG